MVDAMQCREPSNCGLEDRRKALGIVVLSAVNLSRYATSWAAIVVASIMGIAFYGVIALVERYALSWHPSVARRG
jgi:ABC-type nitrate/sulfonate/bicarbonate transport system permease component